MPDEIKDPDKLVGEKNVLLYLENIHFGYKKDCPVLKGLRLILKENETYGLAGANGSGKSTLFRCITGLETVKTGRIIFLGRIIANLNDYNFVRAHTGYVLQNPDNQIVFPTVIEDVMFGPINQGYSRREADERAHCWLEKLGISKLGSRIVTSLSGGEKKLVALAGILSMEPELLLLDEPMNELDEVGRERLTDILYNMKCAKIIASHDNITFQELNCTVWQMKDGQLY